MPLPTIQPFDYPDWGAPGTVTAADYNIPAITISGEVVFEAAVGYYNHTLLVFNGNGDGESYSVSLQWMTAGPSEGGSIAFEQFVTVVNGCTVVVPVTNPTAYLRIVDAGASAYPHNVLLLVTQYAAYGNMVGYPGGETVLLVESGTSGAESLIWAGSGCAPGRHALKITSEAPTWTVTLRTFTGWGNSFDALLADETSNLTIPIEWIAPASSWQLIYNTSEAGDHYVWAIVTRLP